MRSPFPNPIPKVLAVVALGAILAQAAPPASSPFAGTPKEGLSGQVRTRTELDHKALYDTSANKTMMNTHLRSRLGYTAMPSPNVEIKVEVQDTRFMGSEPSAAGAPHTASIGNRQGIDLIQGYVAVQEGPVKIALGRQKMQLGAGRYLSSLEWHPYSRAFDGVSANWSMDKADLTAFAYLVSDSSMGLTPAGGTQTSNATSDRLLLAGLHYNRQLTDNITVEGSLFHDHSQLQTTYSGETSTGYSLYYIGQRVAGKQGIFTFEEEFLYQAGKVYGATELTSAAWQLALRAGVSLPNGLKANLGLDAMSGDDDLTDDKTTMYRANYFFGHAYFGWMDYFLANPRFGVMDYRADVSLPVWKGETRSATLMAQYHYFTPQKAPSALDNPYGQEIDAELHLSLFPRSNVVIGAGVFLPGDGAALMATGVTKLTAAAQPTAPGYFFYFMPVFNF